VILLLPFGRRLPFAFSPLAVVASRSPPARSPQMVDVPQTPTALGRSSASLHASHSHASALPIVAPNGDTIPVHPVLPWSSLGTGVRLGLERDPARF